MSSTSTIITTATPTWPRKIRWTAVASRAGSTPAEPIVALAIAPNTATPSALPSDRRKMLLAVTTPRSLQPTLDWATISVAGAVRPMPSPRTRQYAPTSYTVECSSSSSINSEPVSTITAPISAHWRKPIRRYTRPAWLAAIGQPSSRVASAKPATSGPVPSTTWTYVGTYDVTPSRIAPTPA